MTSGERKTGRNRVALMQLDIEQVTTLARHLPVDDRALIQGVFERGMTPTAMARTMGDSPDTVRKRVRRIARRLGSPLFRFVVRNMDHWPDIRRSVADAVVLRGYSYRRAARLLNVTIYRVRTEHERIRIMCESSQL
jgi:DNA-directed RNA polymerase specialized sigma24 family protein